MSGLFGIVEVARGRSLRPGGNNARIFDRMAERLRHDDRYVIDTWEADGVRLGRVGLPHLHSVRWPQPAKDHQGTVVFCAGSMHESGAKSAIGSDLEGIVEGLRGFFSVALYAPVTRELVLAVDRHASVPIFYAECQGVVVFAPEIKAILEYPDVGRQVDPGALASFLVSGHVLGDETLFRTIRRLPGGSLLRADGERLRRQVYWVFHPGSRAGHVPTPQMEVELGELVEASAQRNLGSPDRTAIFLSGGVDSRAILGGALAVVGGDGQRLNAVTWGASADSPGSDLDIATQIASRLNLRHRFIRRDLASYVRDVQEVTYLIDGLSEIAAFHPHEYRIMRDLQESGFQRVLRGDETFGWGYHVASGAGALRAVGLRRLRGARGLTPLMRADVHNELAAASDASIDAALAETSGLSPDDAKDSLYFAHRLQCLLNTASYYKRLVLDQRNVLLDEEILTYLEQVPARDRIEKRLFTAAMSRRYPDLYRLPLARDQNLEDWEALLRAPTPLRAFVAAEFSDSRSGIWEYFDPADALSRLERVTEGPLAPRLGRPALRLPPQLLAPLRAWWSARATYRISNANLVMRLLVLKLWHDMFVTGSRAAPRGGGSEGGAREDHRLAVRPH